MAINGFLKSRWIISVAAITAIGLGAWTYTTLNKSPIKVAYVVEKGDVKETVLTTGTVTSETNLSLSFKSAGVLSSLRVKVGDTVRKGQILAQLDERNANVQLERARASELSAKANYDKLINGSSIPEINVAEAVVAVAYVNLQNAKTKYDSVVSQQKVLVANAYSALLNSELRAIPDNSSSTKAPTVSGTYTGTEQGQIKIQLYTTGGGGSYSISGLDSGSGQIIYDRPISFGTKGLFLTFSSSGTINSNDSWTISIPNTQATNYVGNFNAFQSAIQTQSEAIRNAQSDINSTQAALAKAQADLDLKKAPARIEDINSAKANLDKTEADLLDAQNNYDDNIIYAPIDGTINSVDIKIGEQVSPQKEVIMILNKNLLHVESNISESSVVYLHSGQVVNMTLDAFGPDKNFTGKIISIDPAATVISGVINYKMNSTIPDDSSIRPGMSVNLTIVIGERKGVLAIPTRFIHYKNGNKIVSVIRNNQLIETVIETGLAGDNLTEIVSGLSEGDSIASQ